MAEADPVAAAEAAAAQAEAAAQAAEAEVAAAKAQSAPTKAKGTPTVTLAVVSPPWFSTFDPSIDGWVPVTRDGTAGPSASASEVVAAAAAIGIQIETR